MSKMKKEKGKREESRTYGVTAGRSRRGCGEEEEPPKPSLLRATGQIHSAKELTNNLLLFKI